MNFISFLLFPSRLPRFVKKILSCMCSPIPTYAGTSRPTDLCCVQISWGGGWCVTQGKDIFIPLICFTHQLRPLGYFNQHQQNRWCRFEPPSVTWRLPGVGLGFGLCCWGWSHPSPRLCLSLVRFSLPPPNNAPVLPSSHPLFPKAGWPWPGQTHRLRGLIW